MSTKHCLTIILIFATILLSGFSVKSQNSSGDTIRIEKNGFKTVYYHHNRILSNYQLIDIVYTNKIAHKFLQEAQALHTASLLLGIIGGFAVGFSAGYAIIRTTANLPVNWAVILPIGIGSAFIICGISFEMMAKQRIAIGVKVYNNSIKQSSSTNLGLGFSTNGMMLRLNF